MKATRIDIDMDDLLKLATTAAWSAGELLVRGLAEEVITSRTKSSPFDLVTEIDRMSENRIIEVVTDHRPDDGFYGEESSEHPGSTGLRWVIDPLDGTSNYVNHNPNFVVSIAAELNGRVEIGVVHDPVRGETFSAVRGRGAWCDSRRISVSEPNTLGCALLSTGFSSDPAVRARQAALVVRVIQHVRDLRSSGSAALDLCWVAAGRIDAYFESGARYWDWAAGALIAAEAGAWVGGAGAKPPGDELVIACPTSISSALRRLLAHD